MKDVSEIRLYPPKLEPLRIARSRSPVLQSLTLDMSSSFFWSPNFSVGTLHPFNPTFDRLSNAIRMGTAGISTLKRLSTNGTIDGSLRWPSSVHGLSGPYWQNLEHLEIHFDIRRKPSGGLYFCNPRLEISAPIEAEVLPGYGSSKEGNATSSFSFSPNDHIDEGGLLVE